MFQSLASAHIRRQVISTFIIAAFTLGIAAYALPLFLTSQGLNLASTHLNIILGGLGLSFLLVMFVQILVGNAMLEATKALAKSANEGSVGGQIDYPNSADDPLFIPILQPLLSFAEKLNDAENKIENLEEELIQSHQDNRDTLLMSKLEHFIIDFEKFVTDLEDRSANLSIELEKVKLNNQTNQTRNQDLTNAASDSSTSVQTVAAATEQMSASLREISSNLTGAAQAAKNCAGSAQNSKVNLDQLQDAIEEIDSVIQSISYVAKQTSLLALNATIESSHAGEAGKGFAVVANEVKGLAQETHKMTDEISSKVSHIKLCSQQTIGSVNDILSQIESVEKQTANVAAAVEEQNVTTAEISSNIHLASEKSRVVSDTAKSLIHDNDDAETHSDDFLAIAQHINSRTKDIKDLIQGFNKTLKA